MTGDRFWDHANSFARALLLLVGVTPGGFEKMFQERQGVDAATNRALMQKHHMEVVGPPLQ